MKSLSAYIFCYVSLCVLHKTISLSNRFDCKVPEPPATLYLIKNGQLNKITNASMLEPNVTTYFIVHGWYDDSSGVQKNISEALESKGNSILIDYWPLAQKSYLKCVDQIVLTLGRFLTDFIVNATIKGQLKPENIYLIGQSVGAHVVGYVGRTVQNRTNQQIQRISALDPAGPVFNIPSTAANKLKLRATDAAFVDVLHTSFLGLSEAVGTVDVYARGFFGTKIQRACLLDINIVCSHGMSKVYYLESINSCGIIANRIGGKDTVVYGFHMPVTTKGSFEFSANRNSPYGSGKPKC